MKIELIDFTGKGMNDPWYAAALMIWTKRTRVEMSPGGLQEILSWPEEKKLEELKYMAATIPSSWEFVSFTFLITDVTRAFTHQLVRTRNASFAQQTQQILKMKGWGYYTGRTIAGNEKANSLWQTAMKMIGGAYDTLAETDGVKLEDARGILPTNILTNIVMKINLRAACDLLRKRISPRNMGAEGGEWDIASREIRRVMIEAMPWTDVFLNRDADNVGRDLYEMAKAIPDPELRTKIYKAVDQLLTNVGSEHQ